MNKNDLQIKELINVVAEKKKSLGKLKREPLNTNGIFKWDYEERNGKSQWFNINTISDKAKIVEALAWLIMNQNCHDEACEKLGVKVDFSWGGYSAEDWEGDFKARIAAIEYNERKKSMDDTQKKLDTLISSEGKTAMEIDAIKDLLLTM